MYSPNFRLPTLSERQRTPEDCLYDSERKNREEEKQDRELGERVDRLKERMWAIIEMSRARRGSDTTDSDSDTAVSTPDIGTP